MYFITTVRACGNILDDVRTVGFESSYRDAMDKVLNNSCDIFEDGYYQYAVITYVEEGLYPNKSEQQWFTYNRESREITITTKPAEIENAYIYILG